MECHNNDVSETTEGYAEGGSYGSVLTEMTSSNSRTMLMLLKIDEDSTSIEWGLSGITTAGGSGSYTLGTIGNLTDGRVLTSNQGGNLLDLANEFKDYFFNGETQTAASLFEYMCDTYGSAAGFAYSTTNNFPTHTTYIADIQGTSIAMNMAPVNRLIELTSTEQISLEGLSYPVLTIPSEITTYTDAQKYLNAALIFDSSMRPPVNNQLKFDVYVNGTDSPNISIRWSGETSDDFSLQTVNPMVWIHPVAMGTEQVPVITVDGIQVPNDSEWYVKKNAFTFSGQYDGTYLGDFDSVTSFLSTFDKVVGYGIDGIANRQIYYLRFNQQVNLNNQGVMTWGDLCAVNIPKEIESLEDITVTYINGSSNNPGFITNVEVHLGAAPDTIEDDDDTYDDGEDAGGDPGGVYDPDHPKPDFSAGESNGFPGNSVLTTTYSMDALVLRNIGSKLWTQSYFDVLKIQNNPIENIVSCKWFPFSITGAAASFKVGNVDFEINASKIDNIYRFTLGSWTYSPSNASFLNLSPYTTIKLHLPYVGIVQLDASELYNRKLTVKYVIDLISGDTLAMLILDDDIPYLFVTGNCGVDIPLTATNRSQTELKAASATMSAVIGASAHVMSGDVLGAAQDATGMANVAGMDYTSQRTTAHSPACMTYANRYCYVEVIRPGYNISEGFKSRHGYPCHKFKTLNELSGFVKCDIRTKLDFASTTEENKMIEQLLTEGVYV